MAAKEHFVPKDKVHTKWNNALPPALTVDPGDVVVFEAEEVTGGQLTPSSTAEDLTTLDFDKIYPLAGPVAVQGAEPGDVLEIDILDLKPGDWGWSALLPGFGLLAEDFKDPYIKIWDLSNGETAELRPGIVIALEPFCGTMGVAPAEPGEHFIMPPGPFGGNMDIRHLNAGNTLLLPIQVAGGLFSLGDCHAVQGDGEVCVTAIECPMTVTLRLTLRKDLSIQEPQFTCKGPLTRHDSAGYHVTTGIGPDLMEDAQKAVRYMIEWLQREHGLGREEAYILCSVVGDLKISQVVDQPNWIVSFYMPLSVFQG